MVFSTLQIQKEALHSKVGTLPGRQTSTEAPTCQEATMSIAHMSNSTSLQAVSNQERLTDIQGGCGACQGCDVGHDGFYRWFAFDAEFLFKWCCTCWKRASTKWSGNWPTEPTEIWSVGGRFSRVWRQLGWKLHILHLCVLFIMFLIFDVFMLCNLYPLSVVWCFLWVSYTFTITQSIYKVVLTRGIQTEHLQQTGDVMSTSQESVLQSAGDLPDVGFAQSKIARFSGCFGASWVN